MRVKIFTHFLSGNTGKGGKKKTFHEFPINNASFLLSGIPRDVFLGQRSLKNIEESVNNIFQQCWIKRREKQGFSWVFYSACVNLIQRKTGNKTRRQVSQTKTCWFSPSQKSMIWHPEVWGNCVRLRHRSLELLFTLQKCTIAFGTFVLSEKKCDKIAKKREISLIDKVAV